MVVEKADEGVINITSEPINPDDTMANDACELIDGLQAVIEDKETDSNVMKS